MRIIAGELPHTLVMEHPVIRFSQREAQPLLKELRSARRRFRRRFDTVLTDAFLSAELPMIVNDFWVVALDEAEDRRLHLLERLRTREGDRVSFQTVSFAVEDAAVVAAALRTAPDFDAHPNGTQFAWLAEGTEPRSVLGVDRGGT